MKPITMEYFYDRLVELIDVLEVQEGTHIVEAAQLCAEAIAKGGKIQVFGSGHSVGFGKDMTGMPGSLLPVNQMNSADFVIQGKVTYEDYKSADNKFERRPGVAQGFFDLYAVNENDVFIVISNSGINGLVIDTAMTAKEKGHKVIIVTSMQHTLAEPTRHPSGKKLYQFGDVVIDNCGPQGDALLETGQLEKVCAISSIMGAFIAQSIVVEVGRILDEQHVTLPLIEA